MCSPSPSEMKLHFALIECRENILPKLSEQYGDHLLKCLHRWYKRHLVADPSLACEAVYNALQLYSEHPRLFNPEQGSLIRFLELSVDRMMQRIFERENYHIQIHSIEHLLAKYFDNDRDVLLARHIIKNENDTAAFVSLLNIGGYRINHQLAEVKRYKSRVKKTLDTIPKQPSVRKKSHLSESETVLVHFAKYRHAHPQRQYVL